MQQVFYNSRTIFSDNAFETLVGVIADRRTQLSDESTLVLVVDSFLEANLDFQDSLSQLGKVNVIYPPNGIEPTTDYVDDCYLSLSESDESPLAVVGIGGGSALDIAKALSNLIGNKGKASDYQGWELLQKPGAFKIGIPTLFGTGSETSRTCVLLNKDAGLKLGMNSKFSLFDELIIDSSLSLSSPKLTWGLTAMDGYFHAVEILEGQNRIAITDEFASTSKRLIERSLNNYHLDKNKASMDLALGSYFGGMALANGIVGLVHPFSAALSVVFGLPHALANCMSMVGLTDYYPKSKEFFFEKCEEFNLLNNRLQLPLLEDKTLDSLINATIVHEKPLRNHLGDNWQSILNKEQLRLIFQKILQSETK